jgi:hypothetical protein
MIRRMILAVIAVVPLCVARGAQLEGVWMPDSRIVNGTRMVLNGIGLRTYSILGIRVYVAGLYLRQRSSNAELILHSREMKLLDIRFLRDVDPGHARQAWRDGFADNCEPPCHLEADDVSRFLAAVPAMHRGEESLLLFTEDGVSVTLNGRLLGEISDPHFAEAMLATFIGPEPPTLRLKRGLLGGGN